MIGTLRKLFARDPLRAAIRRGDWRAVREHLATRQVLVYRRPHGAGFDPATVTQEQIVAEAKAAAVAADRDENWFPLTYDQDGEHRFPFFTDQAAAERFAGAYASKVNRIHALQLAEVAGEVVLALAPDVDRFVLNDQSQDETELPAAELASAG